MIFGGNQKFISSQTSIFAGFFYVQKNPSLGFSTMIFGGNQKFISSQTSIFAGFFYVQKNLTKKILPVYIYSAIVL